MKNTLQTLQKKRKSKKGFTLMEMLIVVAIIAILVAISMPVFTAQLDKARESTDAANLRAAKAVAAAQYLSEDVSTGTYYFKIDNATLETNKPTTGYGETTGHKNQVIEVKITTDSVTAEWVAKGT